MSFAESPVRLGSLQLACANVVWSDLDAWIEVMVPDEKEEAVHDALIQRAHEIFMEEGYDIGVHVTERSAIPTSEPTRA